MFVRTGKKKLSKMIHFVIRIFIVTKCKIDESIAVIEVDCDKYNWAI